MLEKVDRLGSGIAGERHAGAEHGAVADQMTMSGGGGLPETQSEARECPNILEWREVSH